MTLIPPHLFYPLDNGQALHVVPQGPDSVLLRFDDVVQSWTFQGLGIEDWQVPRGSLGTPLTEELPAPSRSIGQCGHNQWMGCTLGQVSFVRWLNL